MGPLVYIYLIIVAGMLLHAIFSAIFSAFAENAPFLLSIVGMIVALALAMALTHGWIAFILLGLVYLFAIFRICRWALRAWSRRKLTGSWRKPLGDGDTSYFQG
jgi:hypothetical protein